MVWTGLLDPAVHGPWVSLAAATPAAQPEPALAIASAYASPSAAAESSAASTVA